MNEDKRMIRDKLEGFQTKPLVVARRRWMIFEGVIFGAAEKMSKQSKLSSNFNPH